MYTTEQVPLVTIEVDEDSIVETCGACPTILDFKDKDGTNYYFRLRWGTARIVCEDRDETICSGDMGDEYDGVATWDDVIKWAAEHNVILTENE